MIDSIANNETGASVRGKLNDAIDLLNGFADPDASVTPVQTRYGVTALTGGGATGLDGIATVDMAVGTMIAVVISNSTHIYRLISATTAENSPYFIRPDDYAGTTNEKVWRLLNFTTNSIVAKSQISVIDSSSATVIALGIDGSAFFNGQVSLLSPDPPTNPTHAVTKGYVDGAVGVCGTLALGNGVSGGTVTGLDLDSGSPTAVLLTVQIPTGGGFMSACLVDAPTSDGFTFALSGMTDSTNYKLHYHVIT